MPQWDECSIYEEDCRKGICSHKNAKEDPMIQLTDEQWETVKYLLKEKSTGIDLEIDPVIRTVLMDTRLPVETRKAFVALYKSLLKN